MKRVQGAESSTELFGRKKRGFAVFSLPGPGLPHSHSTVLYRTLQKTEWRSHYCYEGCKLQGGGEGPQNTAVQTLLLNMAWDDNRKDLHGVRIVASDAKGCSMKAGFQEVAKRQQSSFPFPSWIQQQSFPTGLFVLYFKIKKTVTYPTTQACKSACCSWYVCRVATVMDKAATVTTWRGYFLKEKKNI